MATLQQQPRNLDSEIDELTDRFNVAVVTSLTDETIHSLDAASGQLQLLDQKLKELTVRCNRALEGGRLHAAASLELQRDTVLGLYCMYKEYIKRKVHALNRLHRYRQDNCRR